MKTRNTHQTRIRSKATSLGQKVAETFPPETPIERLIRSAQSLKDTGKFNEAVQQNKDAKTLLLLVSDGQNSRFLVLKASE